MSKIYVVDDEFSIRDMCYDLFKDEGHDVVTVPTGAALLELIQKDRPDLILMDINIPGEEGLSLLHRMPNEEGRRIPVVIFSGSLTPALEKEAFRYGAVDVIAKGENVKDFFKRIEKALKRGPEALRKKVPNTEQAVPQEENRTLLVVDDESSIVNLLKEFFESKGFPVVTAASGEEALEMVKNERPKMVLLDVTMPGMDGIVTLKKIREIDEGIGVVMATGVEDESVAEESIRQGAYAYVLKPFDMDYLEMVVLTRLVLSA